MIKPNAKITIKISCSPTHATYTQFTTVILTLLQYPLRPSCPFFIWLNKVSLQKKSYVERFLATSNQSKCIDYDLPLHFIYRLKMQEFTSPSACRVPNSVLQKCFFLIPDGGWVCSFFVKARRQNERMNKFPKIIILTSTWPLCQARGWWWSIVTIYFSSGRLQSFEMEFYFRSD